MVRASPTGEAGEQHSLWRSVALHLLPGGAILLAYVLLVPVMAARGYPPLLALLIAAMFGVSLQAAHLVVAGRRRNGTTSLRGIVLYTDRARGWQYVVFPVGLVLAAFGILMLVSRIDLWILRNWMGWLPGWYNFADPTQYARYPRDVLMMTFGARLIVDGAIIPVVEELYFRGYLMPRLSRFGGWTPIIHHGLFTLYHFWQPFNYVTIFFGVLPMTWVAWRTRNIRFAIVTHLLLNLIGAVGAFGLIASSR